MAACGSLQHIFEKPLPENPTLLESLSQQWNQIKNNPSPTMQDHSSCSFTEIFGELHFKESSLFQTDNHTNKTPPTTTTMGIFSNNNYSFARSRTNCTEGLGFESSDEVEDILAMNDNNNNTTSTNTSTSITDHCDQIQNDDGNNSSEWMRLERSEMITNVERDRKRIGYGGGGGKRFPPPISWLSTQTGKPKICFESYREDGRFVLKEIRVRSQEFLHACREDGRLKLHFVQPTFDEEIPEDDEEDNNIDDDENQDGQ